MRAAPHERWLLAGMLAAWLGAWGTWLAHPSAGLTQTALDLAQVSHRLPDVLYGRLAAMPGLLRASVGLAVVGLSVAGADVEGRLVRWLVRGLGLLLIVRLLPPYPDVLALWRSPDYGGRFVLALAVLAAWGLSLSSAYWPTFLRRTLILILGLIALVSGVWANLALQAAFQTSTGLSFKAGWGLALYAASLALTVCLSLLALLRPQRPPDSARQSA